MLEYYEKRQPEYEAIYAKPERQQDLQWLEQQVLAAVDGQRVLELACGTGYWTRRMAPHCAHLRASDASEQLTHAALRSCTTGKVLGEVLDALALPAQPDVDCVVAGFFYSHVRREQQLGFLAEVAQALTAGSRLLMFDNRYVPGSSSPISRTSEAGDSYQWRQLANGERFEVLKNFPSEQQLRGALDPHFDAVELRQSQYFWCCSAQCRG